MSYNIGDLNERALLDPGPWEGQVLLMRERKKLSINSIFSTQNVVIFATLNVFAQLDLKRSRCWQRFKFITEKL